MRKSRSITVFVNEILVLDITIIVLEFFEDVIKLEKDCFWGLD
jgi:hypothetical protein